MEKHQQFKLDSNVPNGTDYKHVPSTEKGYFYKSQKERLILEDLAKLKQGMKTAFTEKEYQAFCRWSRLLISAIQYYEKDFKKKSTTSIIYCILILVCGYLNVSRTVFWKAMSVQKGLKDNLRTDRIKKTACYQSLKKVFKEILKKSL